MTAALLVTCMLFGTPTPVSMASSANPEISEVETHDSEEIASLTEETDAADAAVDDSKDTTADDSKDTIVDDSKDTIADDSKNEAAVIASDENADTINIPADEQETEQPMDTAETAPEEASAADDTASIPAEIQSADTETLPDLFERIMNSISLEEIDTILAEAKEEEFAALTEEQNREIDAHIETLEPDPLPEIVIEETTEETVVSEIIYPTVSFADVAPFGDPVIGGAE